MTYIVTARDSAGTYWHLIRETADGLTAWGDDPARAALFDLASIGDAVARQLTCGTWKRVRAVPVEGSDNA